MNKKIIAVLIVMVLACASVFATGFGAQGGRVGDLNEVAFTFKLDTSPYVYALNFGLYNEVSVGISADRWLANKTFAAPFAYFYGVGGAASFIANDNIKITIGPRLVGGANVFLVKQFELYAQIAWQPSLVVDTAKGITPVIGNFPVNAGFRFWF